MLQMLYDGGFLMIPIGICSILAVMFTVERYLYLRRNSTSMESFWDDIEPSLSRGDWREARRQLETREGPLAEVVLAGLDADTRKPERVKEEMEDRGTVLVPQLERFLPALNFIAQVSPLLGLLGTVSGMIQTFSAIAEGGVGKPDLLAGGISQALITTAAGLTVGILALFFHHLLSQRVDSILHDLEVSVNRMQNLVAEAAGTGEKQ